jgi:hypothetical protein
VSATNLGQPRLLEEDTMSHFKMPRFKSLLLCAGLLSCLFGSAFAQDANTAPPPPHALAQPEQRLALVIGNSNYQHAPQLPNPDNDAQSMAQLLNSAGFEVIAATDLTQNDMIKVVQDFSAKIAARGANTVAMIYYAGHGVQLAGENYLVPVDAKISSPSDLESNAVRLVDVMATLDAIPSRLRIVVLDACRNNPFPTINDAGRGLAIVDAPNGSIVGYSTAPGAEAQDGSGGHSPYTQAFLQIAREPNVPIEQLFKRVRLEVNHATDGVQTPWESSSLTSDFTFFGDSAVAASRPPAHGPVVQMASNLPMRSARQAYDYVLSEGSPDYYQEFIQMFPHDPLCDRIRWLLANLLEAEAWHRAVLANSPLVYKAFYDNHGNSPYAQAALKLQSEPKIVPLMQPTHLLVSHELGSTLKLSNAGPQVSSPTLTKIVTLPAPAANATSNAANIGKVVTLPVTVGKAGASQELKGNGAANHLVEPTSTPHRPVKIDGKSSEVLKLNANPPPGHRFQGGGGNAPIKTGGNINANAELHVAQSAGHRAFMH